MKDPVSAKEDAVKTRLLLTCLVLSLALGACSSDDPVTPAPTASRDGFDFADLDPGAFATSIIEGYRVAHDGTDEGIDTPDVVDLGHGDRGLTDAVPDNDLGAEVVITNTTQRLFVFGGLDAADLLEGGVPGPSSWIRVRGYRIGELVDVDYFGPTSTGFSTFDAVTLADAELDEIRLDILSTGDDDFCVEFLELEPTASAYLHFDDLPAGEFVHLFNGEFELTWIGTGDQPVVVDAGDGDMVLADPDRSNGDGARFILARSDGGPFVFDAAWLRDLGEDPAETHDDSRLLVEGYDGETPAGAESFVPVTAEAAAHEATALSGVEVTSLQIEIRGYQGTFIDDDWAVSGLLVTISD